MVRGLTFSRLADVDLRTARLPTALRPVTALPRGPTDTMDQQTLCCVHKEFQNQKEDTAFSVRIDKASSRGNEEPNSTDIMTVKGYSCGLY